MCREDLLRLQNHKADEVQAPNRDARLRQFSLPCPRPFRACLRKSYQRSLCKDFVLSLLRREGFYRPVPLNHDP